MLPMKPLVLLLLLTLSAAPQDKAATVKQENGVWWLAEQSDRSEGALCVNQTALRPEARFVQPVRAQRRRDRAAHHRPLPGVRTGGITRAHLGPDAKKQVPRTLVPLSCTGL